jgi:hypothetical protein
MGCVPLIYYCEGDDDGDCGDCDDDDDDDDDDKVNEKYCGGPSTSAEGTQMSSNKAHVL